MKFKDVKQGLKVKIKNKNTLKLFVQNINGVSSTLYDFKGRTATIIDVFEDILAVKIRLDYNATELFIHPKLIKVVGNAAV